MGYRLGLDIGARSIGWCSVRFDAEGKPCGILDIGARIFQDGRDPQKGASLAVDRRIARGMRRRRDRYLLRRADLMDALVRHGLMPADEHERKNLESLDPYELRARGLDRPLSPFELGRALFHLAQRRGFKSNRKADSGGDKEAGKIKDAADRMNEALTRIGARTVGEFLHHRQQDGLPVRVRLNGEGAKASYEFYPQRDGVRHEFDALWNAQRPHIFQLTDDAKTDIAAIMFRQRPLKPVDPGKCALDPTDERAPRALPLVQEFRMLQELANLTVRIPGQPSRCLTLDERDAVLNDLRRYPKRTFEQIRKRLQLPDCVFNLESEKREYLKGDETAAALSHKDRFGKDWRELDRETQDRIVERLIEEEDEEALIAWLGDEWGLDRDRAAAVAGAPLPSGYGRIGRRALQKIVPLLLSESVESIDPETGEIIAVPITYDEAARRAGYDHSDRRPDKQLERLPYYGVVLNRHTAGGTGDPADPLEVRYGRIANPTVHIGLNQLRRIVNAVIAAHGPPAQVAIELTRELKLGRERVAEIEREQAERAKENERIDAEIVRLGLTPGGENRRRFRLWEELDVVGRQCVYTGEIISARMALSDETEIDHILPFSRSLDDGMANQVLCMRRANRQKLNETPHEAFGHNPAGYDYSAILSRAAELPSNKRWRFDPDAAERMERDGGFIARQLNDTAYLARIARAYVSHIAPPDSVWVTPGRLTAMLRGKWGLNSLLPDANFAQVAQEKNRKDHRHHAIDAFVTAVTDRSLLQRVATAAARATESGAQRVIEEMPEPWPDFDDEGHRDDLRERVNAITVSHKSDHGIEGKLHEEMAYGIVARPEEWDDFNLVYRKPLIGLNENEVARIRDPVLRKRLQEHLDRKRVELGATKLSPAQLKECLTTFSDPDYRDVRRVRLLKKEAEVIALRDRNGRPYKAYVPGDNHHIDIYQLPDGKWAGEAVTTFDVNQPRHDPKWQRAHPTAQLVMQVHKGDLIKLEPQRGEPERVMRVVRLEAGNNRLRLAEHNQSGDLEKRHIDEDDPFRWLFVSFNELKARKARPVTVDTLGRVRNLRLST